jgi:S-formylglutathione hydrolase FrmB
MFPTLELSDPSLEWEGLRFVTVNSPSLGHRADLTLFVPPEAAGCREVPLVILLHGVYGSHWAWALKGGAHRTAARLIHEGVLPPVVLVMPSDGLWGDGSGYVPHVPPAGLPDGFAPDFDRWIVADVPAAVQQAVPCVTPESPRFVSGLSMGGFGALRLAARHPGWVKAASGHSSATHASQLERFASGPLSAYSPLPLDQSVLEAMKANRDRLPPIRFDCGVDDFLIEPNRQLHADLLAAGIAHQYVEFPGAHTWPYWTEHLEDSLRFFAQHLRPAGTPAS